MTVLEEQRIDLNEHLTAQESHYEGIRSAILMYVLESREREILRQNLRRVLEHECPRGAVRRWDEEDYSVLLDSRR